MSEVPPYGSAPHVLPLSLSGFVSPSWRDGDIWREEATVEVMRSCNS